MLKKPDDDLFKDSTMTFGEHLEELRRALFKALIGMVIGCAFGLYFGADVVSYINQPLELALRRYYQARAIEVAREELGTALTPAQEAAINERGMIFEPVYIDAQEVADTIATAFPGTPAGINVPPYSLAEIDLPDLRFLQTVAEEETGLAALLRRLLPDDVRRLIPRGADSKPLSAAELRSVLSAINTALASRDFYDAKLFEALTLPELVQDRLDRRSELNAAQLRELHWSLLHAAYPQQVQAPHETLVGLLLWREVKYDSRTRPQSLGVAEGFMIWLKASFITGFVVASPWVFYQLWMFVAAGLYPHEKRYVFIFLPFSLLLFLAGVYLALFHVFQPVLDFLFSNNAELGIDPDPRIGEWLSFFLMLPLGFGVAFQLPLVMLFLERIGIFTVHSYLAKWKIAILSIVVLACVLTPADPVSFMFLGIPLLALYFLGIAMCWTWPRKGGLQMA